MKLNWKLTLIIVVISLVAVIYFLRSPKPDDELLKTSSASTSVSQATTETSLADTVYVDVKGAVKHPGMYRLKGDARLMDAIEAAGGCVPKADKSAVNLAQKIKDQSLISIPYQHQKHGAIVKYPDDAAATPASTAKDANSSVNQGQDASATGTSGAKSDKININTATATDLTKLDGIGEKRAETIIRYRTEHGSFKSVDDLKNISGIGEKTVAKLKEQVIV